MAIQMRRGAYDDFDPAQMVAGEIAVVLSGDTGTESGKAIYVCVGAGTVMRLATWSEVLALVQGIEVTTSMIADLAITSAKLADGSVLTAKLADGSVTADKLAGSIPASKLSGGIPASKLSVSTAYSVDASGDLTISIE